MGKGLKTAVSLLVIAVMAAGGYYGFQKLAGAEKPAAPAGRPGMAGPLPVITETVAARDMETRISAVGSLAAGESAEIHSEIAGQIEKIFFEEGQPVKKGDVLLQIDRSLIETELRRAQAAYDVAQSSFARDDKLKDSGFLSRQKWDVSRADLQSAKSAVENARIRLEKTTIRAPFDGMVSLRSFSAGDYTEVGRMLTTIVSIDPLKVEFSAPEKNYADVAAGQTITLSVDAFPDRAFEGKIYAIDPIINPDTRNFRIKAEIPNAEGLLRPGMYARIGIATAARSGVIMVPEESIVPKGGDSYVYVIEDGRAVPRRITTGIRDNGRVEAVEGLAAGEEIITAGTIRVRDNMPVVSQNNPPDSGPDRGEK